MEETIHKLYDTYDGGNFGPSGISLVGMPSGININIDNSPVFENTSKKLWRISYTMHHNWNKIAYVVAQTSLEAISLCQQNNISEEHITSIERVEANRVLCQ